MGRSCYRVLELETETERRVEKKKNTDGKAGRHTDAAVTGGAGEEGDKIP